MDFALDYNPQPRQRLLHNTPVRQILFGGAVGGGKSHALRYDAIIFCLENPGLQAYLFRRTLGELEDNHMNPMSVDLPPDIGRLNRGNSTFEFVHGSRINFCYCEKESDVNRYQGAEMHWVGIDEGCHLSPYQLTYIRSRNRLGKFKSKLLEYDRSRVSRGEKPQIDFLPRYVVASNPVGGPGREWLKRVFVDPTPPETVFYDKTSKIPDSVWKERGNKGTHKGFSTIYIPSKMTDNEYIDAEYAGTLSSFSPEMARALREGDWDSIEGLALHNLQKEKHCIPPFKIPPYWTKFMSMDWGTAKPYSISWWAVSEGAVIKSKKTGNSFLLPSGALIRFDEMYGWNGEPNVGTRETSGQVAKKILEHEKENNIVVDYRVLDPQMWASLDGPSPALNMYEITEGRFSAQQARRDRQANYHEVLSRLSGNPFFMVNGKYEEHPMLFVCETCKHWWRTVPSLILDERTPEKGPDTKLEDHAYDDTAYAVASRPFVTTEEDRFYEEYGEEIDTLVRPVVDPYAT